MFIFTIAGCIHGNASEQVPKNMASPRHLKLTYEILEGYKNLLTRKLQVLYGTIRFVTLHFNIEHNFVYMHQSDSIHHFSSRTPQPRRLTICSVV